MWTTNQQTAIDAPVADNLVSAAAGSGKTAVMVERIVRRVVSGEVNIDKLLIVTYTNAAASELKSRLMQEIMQKLDEDGDSHNLNKQLMLINTAPICTIHSFCLDILRNNFHKIGLDPGFKIADTGETELAKREIVGKIFDKYYEDGDSVFLSLVDCYTTKNDKALADAVLAMYEFSMSTPDGAGFIQKCADRFASDRRWEDVLLSEARKKALFAAKMYDEGIEICSFSEKLEKTKALLCDEREMFLNLANSADWDSAYKCTKAFAFDRLYVPKILPPSDAARIKYLRSEAKDICKDICENMITDSLGGIKADIARSAPQAEKLAEIVMNFHSQFSEYKRKKNTVDFSDLEHLALSLLRNSDVSAELSERYEEIYVDEYQDCNSVQEEIFSLVSRKAKDKPNMFMVGDMKQSIYRFRGSEPALFKQKSESYPDFGTGDGRYNRINLNKNFRSRSAVLSGVNSVFRQIMSTSVGELEYTPEEYLYYNENSYEDTNPDTDRTDIILIDENTSESEGESFSDELKGIEAEAVYTANRIKEIVRGGYKVFDKETKSYRDARFSDIVILLRSVKGYAEVYSDILTTSQIPVYCDVGGGYYDTPEISFLINCLKIIDNPLDDIALLSVMRHPVCGFTDDEFVRIRTALKKGYFYDSAERYIRENEDGLCEKLKKFKSELARFYDRSKFLPTDKLIWEICDRTDYMAYLSFLPNAELKKANVRALFSRANDFEKTDFKGVFNFIEYINSLKKNNSDTDTAKTLAGDENLVRIMSIHKSKGLEFPIVFLTRSSKKFNLRDLTDKILLHKEYGMGLNFADYSLRLSYPLPNKNLIKEALLSEAISEEMRVLYVALTRAREKLIVTGCVSDAQKKLSSLAVKLTSEGDKISPAVTKYARSYLDWILLAVMRNKTAPFAKEYGFDTVIDDGSNFHVETVAKDSLVLNIDEGGGKRDFLSLSPDADADGEVEKLLGYSYPESGLENVAANMSVTELKRRANEDSDCTNPFEQYRVGTPLFLSGTETPTAADIGTLTHLVMEKMNFAEIKSADDVKELVANLVKRGFFTENQAKYIKTDNIFRLFETPLGKAMAKHSDTLRREYGFKYLMDASEIDKDIKYGEKIIIQGMADAFFENENGEIVLVDYKTDKVRNGADEIAKRYAPQLNFYQTAIEKCTGKRVCEKYLFLLDSGEVVKTD